MEANSECIDTGNLLEIPHSRLYRIEPIGLGTPYIESVTSYIYRIAIEHCVPVNILLSRQIGPSLPNGDNYQRGKRDTFTVGTLEWKTLSRALNGANNTSKAWTATLEKLTLYDDLKCLTMLPWLGAMSPRGLIRRNQAWCPCCYEDWFADKKVLHNPLQWSIEVIKVCDRHKVYLQTKCPNEDCGKQILALSLKSNATIGFCPHCNHWLGSHDAPILEAKDWDEQQWITKVVGELVQRMTQLPEPLKPEHFSLALSKYLEEDFGNNATALAHRLKMNRTSIKALAEGTQHPQLGTILKISAQMSLSPFDLLTGNSTNLVDQPSPDINIEIHKQRTPIKVDKDAILLALIEELDKDEFPPPSMATVAQRLGYDHSYLLRLFPTECHAISDRYRQYQSDQATNRQHELSRQVREIATMLHEQGIYPGSRQMQKYLDPGILKEKSVRIVHQNVLMELGYTTE